ncbi:MAG: AAA family ATPase, partial [Pseudomonadales bacterium]|nr:AAA family ATPase [Pseudomonadales bacterium]
MKLEHVSIRNYRSIKELDIDFEVSCKVLVGINESGKSNILNALHLLHPEVQPSSKDIRDPIKGEPQPTEAFVRFVFSFSEDEGAEIYDTVKPRFLSKNFDEAIIRINDNDLSLYAFCLSREGIYSANLLTSQKHYLYWAVSRRSGIFPHWKKVMPGCPATVSVAAPDGVKRLLQEYEIVNTKDFPDIPEQYLQPLDAEFLNAIVGQVSSTKTKEWLPKTLFWRYSDDLLLPSKINIAAFCAAPDMCVPLKHMFNLHNIWEIKTAIDTAKDGSANALKNLLARVADTATQHFHEV